MAQDRDAYIRKNLEDIFAQQLRRSVLWGACVFLSLAVLDRVVTPENFTRFLAYRIVISALFIVVYLVFPRLPRRLLVPLSFVLVAAAALVIELMILRSGAHASPYYFVIVLLGVSVTGFVPAPFLLHVGLSSVVYLVYLLPLLASGPPAALSDFTIANVFMLLLFGTMLLVRYLSGRTLAADLGLRYDLEQYRNRLEEVVADRTGELARAIDTLRAEIEERKRAEADRQQLQSQLLQMQKMESIGRLAGGIAHDFNNVLTAIMSYTELSLMKLPAGHPVHDHLAGIQNASEKAAGLTHQLLAFSRKQALAMKAVDLSAVVESMAGMLQRVIGEDIVLSIETERPLRMVLADVGQVEQVIMNLAVNARDAMPRGGSLVIRTSSIDVDEQGAHGHDALKPGAYSMLWMTDSGAGMTREVRERIFEPFFTTKELGMGTGLGLATVYGIVKQHSGYIYVDSDPGRGTTFRVYLPAGDARPLIEGNEPSSALPRGRERILLVEDDPTIRQLSREVLESLGYSVLEAGSGEGALELCQAQKEKIDLLLTDIVMPGINGRELAGRLLSRCPNLRVLFMSGYTPDVLVRQGILEPGAALVRKPLTTGALARMVRRVLDERS